MAYRFLLEVPEVLADAASVAVGDVDDAQVVLIRPSHGLGVDDPYVDMTVAAHTLRVIDALYDWFDTLGASRGDIRIVLHGGDRHSLEASDRGRVVALIRRDQPWVERSIPHVGDHESPGDPAGYSTGPGAPPESMAIDAMAANAPVAVAERLVDASETMAAVDAARHVQIRAINYIQIQVNDLPKAELFYQSFFGMQLLGRIRRGADGTMMPLPRDYSWERALQTGELADVSFFASGPLTLAAQRVGLATRLGQGALEYVSIGVDARTFANLKGEALMRPLTVVRSGVASFVFRDPFNVTWEIAVIGSVPLIPV
jgi:hypothetical protein